MQMQIPQQAAFIISKLREHGHEAYVVGGCVRDTLLGRTPGDWDITTSAKPQEVKALFHRTIDTGIRHGTVTIILNHVGYEVTTYRIDGEYEDGRHPKQVAFTSSLLEDLKRRDFTINAMAYSPQTGLVDEFDGMGDLARGAIRCVGDPAERFTEDALRILRAIRFSAQLDFDIEDQTRAAIAALAPNIAKVSKERIQAELTKLLLSPHPERMREVFETGIYKYLSPAFAKLSWREGKDRVSADHTETGPCHTKAAGGSGTGAAARRPRLSELPAVRYLRWAAFLRDAGEERAVRVLKELKLDNAAIGKARILVAWSGRDLRMEAEMFLAEEGLKNVPAMALKNAPVSEQVPVPADLPAQGNAGPPVSRDVAFARALEITVRRAMSSMTPELWDALLLFNRYDAEIAALTERIRVRGDCLDLKHLAVKGQDLLAAGAASGKEIGDILEGMLEQVLLVPEHNTKEWLMRWAGFLRE